MAKNLKYITSLSTTNTLFESDDNNDFMPTESFEQQFVIDDNNDIMPPILTDASDNEFELDSNGDIVPKE